MSRTDAHAPFYVRLVRRDLGALWEWLPPGALDHDPNAYLKSLGDARAPAAAADPQPVSV